jgi:uncharacterized PurR-regulated membrane protein YhhQ (DUF165 family)
VSRRLTLIVAACGFVATIYLANWLVDNVGPIRVWPTSLLAPAGVYMVGLAFLLRDTIQRFAGQLVALGLIAVGCGVSALVSPTLAGASAAAFAASEIVGLAIFWVLRGNSAGPGGLAVAVIAASAAAAALDSLIFLYVAFGSNGLHAFWQGQFAAKLMVVAVAFPFVLAARRAVLTEATA